MTIIKANKENIYSIIVFVLTFLISTIIIMNIPIKDYDEIFKYYWARTVSIGYVPYKDFNMVTTPLYSYIFSLAMLIDKNIITFRIIESIFWALLGCCTYNIIKHSIDKVSSFIFVLFSIFYSWIVYYVFDYNTLALLFIMISIIILESDIEVRKKYFIAGILCAFIVLSKQTIGVIFTFCIIIASIIIEKANIKRKLVFFIIGWILPNIVFLYSLIKLGSFNSFIDLAFLGLKNFTNNHKLLIYDSNGNISISGIIYLIIPLCIFTVFIIDTFIKKKIGNIYYIAGAIGVLSISVPICDLTHYNYFVIFSLIMLIKIVSYSELKIRKTFVRICITLLLVISTFTLCSKIYVSRQECVVSNINGFSGLLIKSKMYNDICSIDTYINSRYADSNIYYMTVLSSVFSIKNNNCNGFYDLFLTGNLGTKKPTDFIDNIIDNKGIIVIKSEYANENWQNPSEIVPYINERFVLTDTHEDYDIYTLR